MIRSLLLILAFGLLLFIPERDSRYDTETRCWAGGVKCIEITTYNDSLVVRKDGSGFAEKPEVIYERPE